MFNLSPSINFQIADNKLYIYKAYFALALGLLLFLSGCTSPELKYLEDAASLIQLQTGREVDRLVQDKGRGFTGPIYAEIRIDYEPINNYTKKEVYDEIVAILEKNNWERNEWNIGRSDYFSASLRQGRFKLLASVLIEPDKNLVRIKIVNRNL